MPGALRLRRPIADHTPDEGLVLLAVAAGARAVVELGASEGGASNKLRSVMSAGAVLTVIDPYPPGRFGFSATWLIARRTARRQREVETRWLRTESAEAGRSWNQAVDVCVVDAIHTLEGVREDWAAFGRHVRVGGYLVARNDVIAPPEVSTGDRSRLLLAAAAPDPSNWSVDREGGTFTAYKRVAENVTGQDSAHAAAGGRLESLRS